MVMALALKAAAGSSAVGKCEANASWGVAGSTFSGSEPHGCPTQSKAYKELYLLMGTTQFTMQEEKRQSARRLNFGLQIIKYLCFCILLIYSCL
jgi:hypothetical protein